jgi:hypothetical protein
MREILEKLQIKDLIAYAHTHRMGRQSACRIVRGRLLRLLQFFIQPEYLHGIMEIMQKTGAVIGGSAALWLILSPCSWTPDNLEIIVPVRRSTDVVQYFERCKRPAHHSPTLEIDVEYCNRDLIHRIRRITGYGAGGTITITESMSDDIFLPVLAATATYQMNIITSKEILCFYPLTTPQCRALSFRKRTNVADMTECANMGVNLLYTNESWTRPCREDCPSIWRRISGLRGMGRFAIGETEAVGKYKFEKRAKSSHHSWTLGFTCQNTNCPNCKE